MPTEVIMPKVDMDMATGRIVAWHCEDGAPVEKGMPLFDIETDKAAMEIEAPASGLLRHRVPEGTERPIGAPVAWLYAPDEPVGDAPPDGEGAAAGPGPSRSGARPGGAPADDALADAGTAAPPVADGPTSSHPPDRPRATPRARRRAREAGIDLAGLPGTGPRGRVQARDVPGARHEDPEATEGRRSRARAPAAPAGTPAADGPLRVLRSGAGTGTPVVLLHGFASDAAIWTPLEEHLDRPPLIRIELPGHGGSPRRAPATFAALAKALREAFDDLHLEAAHLVGHSLGGALALAIADTRPRCVRSVSLIAPAGLGPQVNGEALSGICRAARAESLAPWLRVLVADERIVTDGYARAAMAARRDPDLRAAQAAMADALFPDGVQAFDLRAALRRLEVPSRIVWGKRDRILPWRQALCAGGGTALHLFEGIGHMPQIEAPEAIGRLLAAGF